LAGCWLRKVGVSQKSGMVMNLEFALLHYTSLKNIIVVSLQVTLRHSPLWVPLCFCLVRNNSVHIEVKVG